MSQAAPASSVSGSLRIFRLWGIDVFVHWTWAVVAYFVFQFRRGHYESPIWNGLEYLSLFGIVLMHEFGHALACRQVGGVAERIMLWPLGGIAFVNPPPRPGPVLWSIAAGPLVNVVLAPLTLGLWFWAFQAGWETASPDPYKYVRAIAILNMALLMFNMLPVYPLDGGQIVQALLWFVLGRARSLMIVSVFGLFAGAAAIGLAVWGRDIWFGVMALFVGQRCWLGFRQARAMAKFFSQPRHDTVACPRCGGRPVRAKIWRCGNCQQDFDAFETQGVCPGCNQRILDVPCLECGRASPMAGWLGSGAIRP